METLFNVLVPTVAAVFAAGGAYMAVRVEIAWIKRELRDHRDELKTLHARINTLIGRV